MKKNAHKSPTAARRRRWAEFDLRKLKMAAEQAAEGFAIVDLSGRIQFLNDAWAKFHGYTVKELIGKNLNIFHTKEQMQKEVIPFNKKAIEKCFHEGEVGHLRRDGTTFPTHMTSTVVKDAKGKPIALVGTARDITARKRTEEALAQSLSLLQATLESTADGILVVDAAGAVVGHNDYFARMWNIPRDVLATKNDEHLLKFVLEQLKDSNAFLDKVQALYANPEAESFDVLEFKDGRIFERYSRPQRIENQVVGRVWSFRNVTEQRKLSEELRRQHEELQAIFDSNPAMIFFKDTNNRIIHINKAFAAASHLSPKEIEGKIASELYPHQDEHYWADDKEVIATGQPKTGIIEPLQTADGVKWLQTDKLPYRDKAGRVIGVLGFALDITERKKMEDTLRENEQLLKTAFHAISDPISLSAVKDGRFIEINNAFVNVLGFTRAEVVGHTSLELNIWEKPEDRRRIIQLLNQNGNVFNMEVNFRRKSGEVFPSLFAAKFIEINGQPAMITVAHDISDFKRTEEERERLNQELSRKNQELETLIRIASHDLRSPLVNIQGFNHLLNKALEAISRILADAVLPDETRQALGASHDKAKKSIRFINAGVDKMNGLINGLLHLSRLGRAPLVLEPLDMNALVHTVLEAMAFQVRTAAVEVTVDALPDCRADAAMINQVFTNLLDNAIKYRDSSRPLRVRIWGRRETNTRTVYCVEDNGPGVAPEHQQKIWDLFFRSNPQGGGDGEGIGLAAVRLIVARHGGDVWMESEIGKGSRFFLTLPSAAEETEP